LKKKELTHADDNAMYDRRMFKNTPHAPTMHSLAYLTQLMTDMRFLCDTGMLGQLMGFNGYAGLRLRRFFC